MTDHNNIDFIGLKTKNLVNYARMFYDCKQIDYVPLENDGDNGSKGSHFERTILFNEIMTASSIKDSVFSGFTNSLLLDSGWYKINGKYVENLEAGKLMGCGWY